MDTAAPKTSQAGDRRTSVICELTADMYQAAYVTGQDEEHLDRSLVQT